MSYAAPQGDGRISRAHCLALGAEIGERLRTELDWDLTDMPTRLLQLTKRFYDEPAAARRLNARDLTEGLDPR